MGLIGRQAETLWFDNAIKTGVRCMRHAIETAPKDGHFVILEDDANASYDVGRWSANADGWVGKDDEPVKITPTHWHPFARDAYLHPDDEEPVAAAPVNKPVGRRSFAAVVSVIAVAMILFYYLRQEAVQPVIRAFSDGKVAEEARRPSRDLNTVPEARWTIEGETSPPAEQEQTVPQQRFAVTLVQDARQSPNRKPSEILAPETVVSQELLEARRTIERLEAQLRVEATAEQVLKQERERAVFFAEHAAAARQELTASKAEHGWVLDEERSRNAALTSELAMARREIETQTAQLRQANNEIALAKEAATSKTAQLLEQHRQNVAALAEAVAARQELTISTAQHSRAIDQERARSAALASELASARREIETLAAQSRQENVETAQSKQGETPKPEQSEQSRDGIVAALAEATAARQELKDSTARHDQALEEERARSVALASELAIARREIETHVVQSRQVETETALLKQAATAKDEQLLEQKLQKEAALAKAAAAREELTANTAQHRQALDEERARIVTLESELAGSRQVNEKLVVQFRLVGEQTEIRRRAYEAETAALQQALRQERDRAAWALELDASRRAASARDQPETATSSPPSREIGATVGTPMPSRVASDVQGSSNEASRMIARAVLLLGQGDIGAARTVLDRAVELGSARAVFMLAETYDPGVLSTWRTYGTQGEVTRARELYAKARAAGILEAKERLDNLGR